MLCFKIKVFFYDVYYNIGSFFFGENRFVFIESRRDSLCQHLLWVDVARPLIHNLIRTDIFALYVGLVSLLRFVVLDDGLAEFDFVRILQRLYQVELILFLLDSSEF